MTPKKTTNNVIVSLYSDDLSLMAQVMTEDEKLYVDFYKDDVLIDSREATSHSVQYAHDIAENYTLGVLRIDKNTWRVDV